MNQEPAAAIVGAVEPEPSMAGPALAIPGSTIGR